MYKSVAAIAAVAVLSLPSYAESAEGGAGINNRQHNQANRIHQGVQSGELNRREAHRLGQEQRQIRQEERAYRSDGKLTAAERRDLHQDQNQASRHIYKEKHDAQDRNPPAPGTRDPGVNARQHVQGERVQQGVRSGELTRDEVKELNQERKSIRQEERAYKSDGVLTGAERKDLHQDLNQASKNIYEQKHDADKRQ